MFSYAATSVLKDELQEKMAYEAGCSHMHHAFTASQTSSRSVTGDHRNPDIAPGPLRMSLPTLINSDDTRSSGRIAHLRVVAIYAKRLHLVDA